MGKEEPPTATLYRDKSEGKLLINTNRKFTIFTITIPADENYVIYNKINPKKGLKKQTKKTTTGLLFCI